MAADGSPGSPSVIAPTATGGTSTIKVDLRPGEYTFFCTVDAHRAGGMEGTLTVK